MIQASEDAGLISGGSSRIAGKWSDSSYVLQEKTAGVAYLCDTGCVREESRGSWDFWPEQLKIEGDCDRNRFVGETRSSVWTA